MSDVDSTDGQICNGFHGPFCGVSDWLLQMHGRWKTGRVNTELIGQAELWTCKVADKHLVVEGKGRAVLRLPAVLFMADEATNVALLKIFMEMESHVWQVPWWAF